MNNRWHFLLFFQQKKHFHQGVIECNRCFTNYFYSTHIKEPMLYQQSLGLGEVI